MPGLLTPGRLVVGARAAWGATLALSPETVLARCGNPPGRMVRLGARALGVRELVEAALQFRRPTRSAARAFRAIDASHAATMLALARRPAYRRAALLSLIVSSVLALADTSSLLAGPPDARA